MSDKEYGPEWRADEIGRAYDRIGAIREYRIQKIRELEGTGQDERLQRILDETQAVIDALTDRIEFLIEEGQAWSEDDERNSTVGQLRQSLWECLEAEGRAIEIWEREHECRPLPEVAEELGRLHTAFRRNLQQPKRTSGNEE